MSIKDETHFELESGELATWIEKQGDRWWNVDGDPLLTGRISFPCPGDEFAAELRKINRTLLVRDRRRNPQTTGQEIELDRIDAVVDRMKDNVQVLGKKRPGWLNDRLLSLCWKGSETEWLLVEDEETTENSRDDFAQASKEE